ncbi:hypothetical protein B0H67DRAFT_571868 [Lasiosphaeris hirsuta]|uniref:Ankyrin repeat protein n=1 Tax=Lasiosphaeris hirsuta TaxID=260670 RepID=A0AA40B1I5_9PEZI|nr:hypothetical protein B0H67DRAFT_571868 [Lasiosphaeris hirsuta]
MTFGRTYGESELKQAIRYGNASAVEELLCLGANPNGSGDSGSSPLADAVKADHTGIVKALFENSASMTQAVECEEPERILGEKIGMGGCCSTLPRTTAMRHSSRGCDSCRVVVRYLLVPL